MGVERRETYRGNPEASVTVAVAVDGASVHVVLTLDHHGLIVSAMLPHGESATAAAAEPRSPASPTLLAH